MCLKKFQDSKRFGSSDSGGFQETKKKTQMTTEMTFIIVSDRNMTSTKKNVISASYEGL